mmetsp:Transcript_6076/g.11183  ORF Transcript_6076/g.11183 Transcript_6076/m.11183 type:complete len:115 (-) Transcript_6076:57-401(-)
MLLGAGSSSSWAPVPLFLFFTPSVLLQQAFGPAMPDFNKPVTLQLGPEPAPKSVHAKDMLMETFFKKYYGENPGAGHSPAFKPDPKGWYEHTLTVKMPDMKSKKKLRGKVKTEK